MLPVPVLDRVCFCNSANVSLGLLTDSATQIGPRRQIDGNNSISVVLIFRAFTG